MGPPLLALAIAGVVAFSQWPGERGWIGYASLTAWLALIAFAAARTGVLPGFDASRREALAKHVQAQVKGRLESEEVKVWGGDTMTEFVVRWAAEAGAFSFRAGVASVTLTLSHAAPERKNAYVTLGAQGMRFVKGTEADVPWITDPEFKPMFGALLPVAGPSGVAFSMDAETLSLSAQDIKSKDQAVRLVELGIPVLEQAARLAEAGATGADDAIGTP